MPALHVRHVPEETIALLKERAARHGRSLEAELREILTTAGAEPAGRLDLAWEDRLVLSDAPAPDREWTRADAYSDELIDGR